MSQFGPWNEYYRWYRTKSPYKVLPIFAYFDRCSLYHAKHPFFSHQFFGPIFGLKIFFNYQKSPCKRRVIQKEDQKHDIILNPPFISRKYLKFPLSSYVSSPFIRWTQVLRGGGLSMTWTVQQSKHVNWVDHCCERCKGLNTTWWV